ncbi:MAG TPA: NAD(P)-binding domain-containing protein, partial [Cyclobacteriaceae bacterium]|nr:NAD(P)-binding domain-containing protein [Cyclobacteriaceae bacterium]
VSGGEEGALLGPSLMPAGSETAKNILMPLLSKIAAKADGQDCVTWVGKNAEGHFVKMLHNGIEYADMQIIAECYAIAKTCLAMNNDTIANMFDEWNKTEAASYLLEISSAILRFMENDEYLIDKILDVAESKGTALWTLQEALELGVPTPSLHAAISQRMLSAQKNIRTTLSVKQSKQKLAAPFSDTDALLSSMIFTRLVAMAEGMHLLEAASKKYDWQIDLPSLLQSWRGGCIIRSELLLKAIEACKSKKSSEHLFQTEIFETMLSKYRSDAAQVISQAHQNGITVPALSAAINYYDAMHTSYLPLNLVQAQRDYFGAHTYRKLDAGQEAFHTNWK